MYLYYCDLRTCQLAPDVIFSRLNLTDRQRFQALKNPLLKQQFSVARCVIKQALFNHFQIPLDHQYQFENFKKWMVDGSGSTFYLSISHSKNIVAVAITQSPGLLGVDVELQKTRDFINLAEMFSTPSELALVKKSQDIKHTFYRLWTVKEAYLKAKHLVLTDMLKIDLSTCLLNDNEHVSGAYYHHYQTLSQDQYVLSLLSSKKLIGSACEMVI